MCLGIPLGRLLSPSLGQFLGSYMVNRVLAMRLVQWLKGILHHRKKERMKGFCWILSLFGLPFCVYACMTPNSLRECLCAGTSMEHPITAHYSYAFSISREGSSVAVLFDWCCFYYFVRNSLVALLEALSARKKQQTRTLSISGRFTLGIVAPERSGIVTDALWLQSGEARGGHWRGYDCTFLLKPAHE